MVACLLHRFKKGNVMNDIEELKERFRKAEVILHQNILEKKDIIDNQSFVLELCDYEEDPDYEGEDEGCAMWWDGEGWNSDPDAALRTTKECIMRIYHSQDFGDWDSVSLGAMYVGSCSAQLHKNLKPNTANGAKKGGFA